MNTTALIRRLKDVVSYGRQLRPDRDWFALIGVTLVAALASVVLNGSAFAQVAGGSAIGGKAAAPRRVPQAASLQKVEELFTQRAAEGVRYQSEYQFVDPSR